MATEVTVVLLFPDGGPGEANLREALEDELDCDVVEYDEQEV